MSRIERHDVDALEAELVKIAEQGYKWGQGPGTEYFRTVEVELIEARVAADLPMLNVIYSGQGYPLNRAQPGGTGFYQQAPTTWESELIAGAFGIVQRIGDGENRKIVAMILDNGEGRRWMVTDLEAIEVQPDPALPPSRT